MSNNKKQYVLIDDGIRFVDLIILFSKEFKLFIYFPLIFCLVAVCYLTFFSVPVYISSAKILSSSNNGNTFNNAASGIAAQFGINLSSGSSQQKWVYPEIIKSRTLARNMLKRKFSTLKYGEDKPLLEILNENITINQERTHSDEIAGINNFIDMVSINEDVKTGVFTLKVKSFEPMLSKNLLDALIIELDKYQKDYNSKKINEARQFIEERIAASEVELSKSEENLKDFRASNRRIENSPSLQLAEQRLMRETAVLTGVFTTLKQQLETTKIEELKKSDYVVILDYPELPLKRSKPHKKRALLLVFFFSIFCSAIVVIIKQYVLYFKKDKEYSLIKTLILKNIKDLLPFGKNQK